MKLRAIEIRGVAGYRSIEWSAIHPRRNLLFGKNGAGKSTICDVLVLALNHLTGHRTHTLITRSYPGGKITLHIAGVDGPITLNLDGIHLGQLPPREKRMNYRIVQFAENRQPKNTVGEQRSQPFDHALMRYHNAISEIKQRLKGSPEEAAVARAVIDVCICLGQAGDGEAWGWILNEVSSRSPRAVRPLSCGQFDLAALVLDIERVRPLVTAKSEQPIVIFDNPEAYLHPACVGGFLEYIDDALPGCQVFIASHSLKLLASPDPSTIFWLSRERQENGVVKVERVRDLDEGGGAVFFELYGDDVSSGVLSVLAAFESPEYYNWLAECALERRVESRVDPASDRQMVAVCETIGASQSPLTILDFGAGHGDLLEALLRTSAADLQYVAVERSSSPHLVRRLRKAVECGTVRMGSRIVASLDGVVERFHRIVLCNVCHEIPVPKLARLFAVLLTDHLDEKGLGRLIIHEVETPLRGETRFILWTPEDYAAVFRPVRGVMVTERSALMAGRVPLRTTVVDLLEPLGLSVEEVGQILLTGFQETLPRRRAACLDELSDLWSPSDKSASLTTALRQRRIAFLLAQIASIQLAEREGE